MRDADFEKAVWAIPCVETAWIPAFGENDTRVCVAVIVVCLSFAVIVVCRASLSFAVILEPCSGIQVFSGNDGTGFPPAGENDSGGGGGSFPPPHGFPPAGENDTHACVLLSLSLSCVCFLLPSLSCVSFFRRHCRYRVCLSFAVILEPCSGIQVFSGKQRGGWKTGDEKACQTTVVWAGAPGGSRTPNPQIRSLMLYPLSYGRTPRSSSPIWAALSTGAGRAGNHHTITPNGPASCGGETASRLAGLNTTPVWEDPLLTCSRPGKFSPGVGENRERDPVPRT